MQGLSDQFIRVALEKMQRYIRALGENPCPDRSLGIINELSYPLNGICRHADSRVILLVESPHVAEYAYARETIKAVGAAQRLFGERRIVWLKNMFKTLGEWELYVVNAIEFQCSVGTASREMGCFVKNEILKSLINQPIYQDRLVERVGLILQRQNLLVDASGMICGDLCGLLRSRFSNTKNRIWMGPKIAHPANWTAQSIGDDVRTVSEYIKRTIVASTVDNCYGIG